MPTTKRLEHPETPFPVGVEYYRAPTPKLDCWDADFASAERVRFPGCAQLYLLELDGTTSRHLRIG